MNSTPERPFSVSTEAYPFTSHWFERMGSWLHYLDEGAGMAVIMLHGNPTWSFLYRKVIQDLGNDCRSIAIDYPGFGFSQHPPHYGYTPAEHAGWVSALIDHLGLDNFILILQDWGGPIGLSVAVERPEAVAGLVLGNTFAWPADTRLMRSFSSLVGGPIGKYFILQHNFFANRLMRNMLTVPAVKTPEIMKAYTDPFPTPEARVGTYVFPWAINHSSEWLAGIEAKLPLLADKPIELVMGMRDRGLANEDWIRRWQGYFPKASLDRVEDAGHYFQEEAPDRVAAAVRRILVA